MLFGLRAFDLDVHRSSAIGLTTSTQTAFALGDLSSSTPSLARYAGIIDVFSGLCSVTFSLSWFSVIGNLSRYPATRLATLGFPVDFFDWFGGFELLNDDFARPGVLLRSFRTMPRSDDNFLFGPRGRG